MITRDEEGNKVVTGCTGHYPPDTLFHYCPKCTVPEVKELALVKPYHLIQSVEIFNNDKWREQWSGGVMFDPETRHFTDGYEKILNL